MRGRHHQKYKDVKQSQVRTKICTKKYDETKALKEGHFTSTQPCPFKLCDERLTYVRSSPPKIQGCQIESS